MNTRFLDMLHDASDMHVVTVAERIDVYFGGAHVASPHGHAAGDPRRGGVARVL